MDNSTKKVLNLMADLIWFPKNTPDVKPLTGVPEGVAFSMKTDKNSLKTNNKNIKNHNTNMIKEPCPFCGSLNLGFQINTEDIEGLPCNISCQDCGASGPWTYVKEEELERELPIIPLSLWNKRK